MSKGVNDSAALRVRRSLMSSVNPSLFRIVELTGILHSTLLENLVVDWSVRERNDYERRCVHHHHHGCIIYQLIQLNEKGEKLKLMLSFVDVKGLLSYLSARRLKHMEGDALRIISNFGMCFLMKNVCLRVGKVGWVDWENFIKIEKIAFDSKVEKSMEGKI
jgi:hypothetical protein